MFTLEILIITISSDFLTHIMIINDCIRGKHEKSFFILSYSSLLSIDAFTNELLNVLFNAMASDAIYNA